MNKIILTILIGLTSITPKANASLLIPSAQAEELSQAITDESTETPVIVVDMDESDVTADDTTLHNTQIRAEELPSLPEVATPEETESGEVKIDPLFPRTLEKRELYGAAILEWERIAYLTDDEFIQRHAQMQIARLLHRAKEYKKALDHYKQLIQKYPDMPYTDEVLYRMATISEKLWPNAVNPFVIRLNKSFAGSPWEEVANYRYLWHSAKQGIAISQLPKAITNKGEELINRIKHIESDSFKNTPNITTALAIIPGAGYAYLGQWQMGIAIFIIAIIIIWTFTYAIKQSHWPYAVSLAIFAGSLYSYSIYNSREMAQKHIMQARGEAMLTWAKLYPSTPKSKIGKF